jgi:hypothetical protein
VKAGDLLLFARMDPEDVERLGERRLSLGSHGYAQMYELARLRQRDEDHDPRAPLGHGRQAQGRPDRGSHQREHRGVTPDAEAPALASEPGRALSRCPIQGAYGPTTVTGMSDDESPEAAKREQWSAGDWRMLFITIAGGLAANLGTVLIVGLGLAYLHQRHSAGISSPGLVGDTGLLCVICAVLFVPVIFWALHKTAERPRWVRWVAWSLAAVLAASALLFLCVLVGLAAGVK